MNSMQILLNSWQQKILGSSLRDLGLTIISLIVLLIVYSFFSFLIRKRDTTPEKKYASLMTLRNSFFVLFIFIQLFLWSGELKTLFISAAAIMAAMIVTFKELIMCFVGSFWVTSNKLFSIGDYIEYDTVKGRVIDKNLLYTKILIGESFYAKELNIPNAVFITNKVINISRFGRYQCYEIVLAISNIKTAKYLQALLENYLESLLSEALVEYKKYFENKKSHDIFFEIPEHYYQVNIEISETEKMKMKVMFLSTPLKHKELEEKIVNFYLDEISKENISVTGVKN
jgi:small-conductance mechanosensitive channel